MTLVLKTTRKEGEGSPRCMYIKHGEITPCSTENKGSRSFRQRNGRLEGTEDLCEVLKVLLVKLRRVTFKSSLARGQKKGRKRVTISPQGRLETRKGRRLNYSQECRYQTPKLRSNPSLILAESSP